MGAAVEKLRTPFALPALRASMRAALGGAPARAALAAWCTPPLIECAWGAACWHNNVGNMTTHTDGRDGWTGDWYRIAAPEYINGRWVEMRLAYRVFPDLERGTAAWVAFMRSNYPRAAAALDAGRAACAPAAPCKLTDPKAALCASCAMKAKGYYTAPLDRYLTNARSVFKTVGEKFMAPERTLNLDTQGMGSPFFDAARNVRDYLVEQAARLVPCDLGDVVMAELCQGRAGWGGYSSCGDLGHYLLWACGVTDPRILNREDAELGMKWATSVNMSELLQGGRALGCWHDAKGNDRPPPGVVAMVGDRSLKEQEHVFIPLLWTGDTLLSADLGQVNKAGKQCGRFVERPFTLRAGRPMLGSRHLLGWVDPGAAPRTRDALELWDRPAADLQRGAKALNPAP